MHTQSTALRYQDVVDALPQPWAEDLMPSIKATVHQSGRKVIILDDDPTGTQTVHDVLVLTQWTEEILQKALLADSPCVFIQTNSRSLSSQDAFNLSFLISSRLAHLSKKLSKPYVIISRSDSTLRGHFPEEIIAIEKGANEKVDGIILCPFLDIAGRYTIDDTHYICENDLLTPVAMSEFANDRTFGYANSDLRLWAEEKAQHQIQAKEALSFSVEAMRMGGPAWVTDQLMRVENKRLCIINALSNRDVEVFASGLLEAEAQGKRFLYRTAASFARIRSGVGVIPFIQGDQLDLDTQVGGLTILGSYVSKSSQQLNHLLQHRDIDRIELDVEEILKAGDHFDSAGKAKLADESIAKGRDVVVFTSRAHIANFDQLDAIEIGKQISNALVNVVKHSRCRPRYLLAKGGITSSDIASRGLDVNEAVVLGQIQPGISIWSLGEQSKYPFLPYIVFPGNVGSDSTLTDVVQLLGLSNK